MISDTLHDAISEICLYVKEDGLPDNSHELWDVIQYMEALRIKYDRGISNIQQLTDAESKEFLNFVEGFNKCCDFK